MNFMKIGLSNRTSLCLLNANAMPLNRTTSNLINSAKCCSYFVRFSSKSSIGRYQGLCKPVNLQRSDLSRYNRTCTHVKDGLLRDGPKHIFNAHFYSVDKGSKETAKVSQGSVDKSGRGETKLGLGSDNQGSKEEVKLGLASDDKSNKEENKLGLVQSLFHRFKALYRDYWYVLVPVHMGTSVIWFGFFYYLAESGVDIIAILESFQISDKLLDPLRSGSIKAGYVALAVALYKLFTPVRYAATLGGTTVSINYLKKWGYIKPIPPTAQLQKMALEQKRILMEKKQNLMDKKDQIKENVICKKNNLLQKRNQIKENVLNPLKDVQNQGKDK